MASLALALAGCSSDASGGSDTEDGSPSGTVADTRADVDGAEVHERCNGEAWSGADIADVTFETADGVELYAAGLGDGPVGVVLIPGTSSSGLCNWSTVAPALAEDGFRVLAVDHRCVGASGCGDSASSDLDEDAVAAVASLRDSGAERVVVMGESRGGAIALATAARPDVEVDGVVALSAVELDGIYSGPDPAPLADLVTRIQAPTLYVSSLDDVQVDQAEYHGWADATEDSSYVRYRERGHGARMLGDPAAQDEAPYDDDLLPFLRDIR